MLKVGQVENDVHVAEATDKLDRLAAKLAQERAHRENLEAMACDNDPSAQIMQILTEQENDPIMKNAHERAVQFKVTKRIVTADGYGLGELNVHDKGAHFKVPKSPYIHAISALYVGVYSNASY